MHCLAATQCELTGMTNDQGVLLASLTLSLIYTRHCVRDRVWCTHSITQQNNSTRLRHNQTSHGAERQMLHLVSLAAWGLPALDPGRPYESPPSSWDCHLLIGSPRGQLLRQTCPRLALFRGEGRSAAMAAPAAEAGWRPVHHPRMHSPRSPPRPLPIRRLREALGPATEEASPRQTRQAPRQPPRGALRR